MTSPSSAAPLAKATLYRLLDTPQSNAAKPTPPTVDTKNVVTVQFNPTSLKISYTNETSGGETTKGQAKQSPVQGHSTLTFDLEFDTAEGEDGQPVDVRDKTSKVLEFVRPLKENPANPPPRIRFVWGAFVFNGIVNSVNEEIDYFDADGRALRAKLSLSIKEQNLDFEVNKSGPANRNANAASKPGEPARAGGPGSGPTKNPLQTIAAQAGESVQQALSRVNALPEQWRSAMGGLQSPLNLAAGTPIQLGPEVSATAGTATTAFGADQVLPTDSSVSGAVSASEEVSAGFSLAASGGIGASVSAVAAARTSAETSSARGAFSVPAAPATAAPTATARASGRARDVHDVDRRSETYGRAVPLRARPQVYGRPTPPQAGRRSGDACRHTMG
jgi:Contractile injection system tube protein